MDKTMLDSDMEQPSGRDTAKIIDHLIHEMENHLQVISMEAHLGLTSNRERRCALDATKDIEKLLEKMRECFSFPR
jgi:hypothetical protein